jgi:hypothetical protein
MSENRFDFIGEAKTIGVALKGYVTAISSSPTNQDSLTPDVTKDQQISTTDQNLPDKSLDKNAQEPEKVSQEIESNKFAEALDKTKSQLEDLADTLTRFFSPLYDAVTPKTVDAEQSNSIPRPAEKEETAQPDQTNQISDDQHVRNMANFYGENMKGLATAPTTVALDASISPASSPDITQENSKQR